MQRFWRSMPARGAIQEKDQWQQRCVPLFLHGDGVAITNIRGKGSKSVDTLSWGSLLSTAPTKYSVYLIWFCMTHVAKTKGFATTWGLFWKRLCKSLQALYDGTWPHEDMEGKADQRGGRPLAGGFCGILYVSKGDLDWMSHHCSLNHTSSATPCSFCQVTNHGHGKDLLPWTDCNSPPRWLRSCWDDEVVVLFFWVWETTKLCPQNHAQNLVHMLVYCCLCWKKCGMPQKGVAMPQKGVATSSRFCPEAFPHAHPDAHPLFRPT